MLTTRYELYLLNVTQVNRSRRPGFDARSVRVRFFGVQGGTGTGFIFHRILTFFPFVYYSTKSSVLFRCSYQKDKRLKLEGLPKSNAVT